MSVPILSPKQLAEARRALNKIPLSKNGKRAIEQMLVEAAASGKAEVKMHSPRAERRMMKAREQLLAYEQARLARILAEWEQANQ